MTEKEYRAEAAYPFQALPTPLPYRHDREGITGGQPVRISVAYLQLQSLTAGSPMWKIIYSENSTRRSMTAILLHEV
jgi:hypothetical protein